MQNLINIKIWVLLWVLKNWSGYWKVSVKVLFAQIIHETGRFKSEVYKENNNLFGMREAKSRKRSVEGTNKGHAVYKNHRQSIIDYFLRQKYFKIDNSNDDAYMDSTVKSNYATDIKYLSKWKALNNSTKTPLIVKLVMYGGLFFFILIGTIIIYKKSKKQ